MVQQGKYSLSSNSERLNVDSQQHLNSGAAFGAAGRDKACYNQGQTTDLSGAGKLSSPTPGGKHKGVWVPPSVRHDVAATLNHQDQIFRRVRGILNKITPERFEKLKEELINVGLESKAILKGVVLLIVDKALDEPKYSFVYAQLCKHLDDEAPNFDPPGGPSTFKRLLLSKCKDEFENRQRAAAAFENRKLTADDEEQKIIAKQKMLGNIRFIGELGKLELLHEKILHLCIKQLLEKKEDQSVSDLSEDLECMCQIMKTIGRRLDTNQAKVLMNQYFERIGLFMSDSTLPSRIRFMLQDLTELREAQWKPRHNNREFGPKLIQEIHNDAAKEGVFLPQTTNLFDGLMMGVPRTGGMTDMFGAVPAGALPIANIGTGPGVIMDGFEGSGGSGNGAMFNGRRNQGSGHHRSLPQKQNQQYMHTSMPSMQKQTQYHHQQHYHNQSDGRGGGGDMLPPRFRRNQKAGNGVNGAGNSGGGDQAQQQYGGGQHHNYHHYAPGASGMSSTSSSSSGSTIMLRPPANSMVQLKPNAPRMLPKSAMMSMNKATTPTSPDPTLRPHATVAQLPRSSIPLITSPHKDEKKKEKKANQQTPPKRTLNAEDIRKLYNETLTEFTDSGDEAKFVSELKENKKAIKIMPELYRFAVADAYEKPDDIIQKALKLLTNLYEQKILKGSDVLEGAAKVLDSPLLSDISFKEHVAYFLAHAATSAMVTVSDVAELIPNGNYHPMFLVFLRRAASLKSEEWVDAEIRATKIKLAELVPKDDDLGAVLQMNELAFLMPMLKVEADLAAKIREEPVAGNVYKWIKEHVDAQQQGSAAFIAVLINCVLKHVTGESTLAPGVAEGVPDKKLVDREKELLARYRAMLTTFVHGKTKLQLEAIYAVQVFCCQSGFPKGMLLRMFVMLYDMEIIDEESFLKWKEDVNDAYPGKGKALFQVNQWLTWLEEAESEDEEDDGDDDY